MKENLKDIQDKSYSLNVSDILSQSWDLYKRVIGIGALAVLIYVFAAWAISYTINIVTGMSAISAGLLEQMQGMGDMERMAESMQDFYLNNWVITLGSQFLSELVMVLFFPLAGGFMLVCREAEQSGYVSAGSLFKGFNTKYWSRLIVLALIYFVLSKVAAVFFIIPAIWLWAAAAIACPIVMFTDEGSWDSFVTSIKLVNKNWFNVFLILLVASLFGLLGYLLFCIGRIFTYPYVLVTIYILYKNIVGFKDDEIDEIGLEI